MNVVNCGHCGGLVDRTLHHSDVVEFMRKFNIDYGGPPRVLPPDLQEFRNKLINEEAQEYQDAKTLAEQFDALIDLLYVVYGAIHLHGFPINAGWERVHRANMAKRLKIGDEVTKRGHSHDLIKPEGWQPPTFGDLIPDIKLCMEEQVDPPICIPCGGLGTMTMTQAEGPVDCLDCDGTGLQP